MKKEYKKVLRILTQKYKCTRFPTSDLQRLGGNNIIWVTKAADSRQICIIFSEGAKSESFDVLVGWAERRTVPMVDTSDSESFDLERGAFIKSEHLLSVKYIGGSHGTGWEIMPPAMTIEQIMKEMEPVTDQVAMERVDPVFKESVLAVDMYALPFLEKNGVEATWVL